MKHYQIGGALTYVPNIANPFSSAAVADLTAAADSGSKSAKNQGLLPDKVMEKIIENGIPVDVDNFMTQLATLERQASMGITVNKSALYSLQAEANRIIKQNDYLKKAEDSAIKNNAVGEIAVGSERGRGQLYVLDSNNSIKTVDLSQYDMEKHGPALTVNELIEHRKFNPTRAFDTTLTLTINNSIGMQSINDWMMKVIKEVGSAETTKEAYLDLASFLGKESAKQPSELQLESMRRLYQALEGLGPDALFKSKEILKDRNIKEAFKYIQSVLPRDMQILLMGRYVAEGGDLSRSGDYMQNLILDALNMTNDTKYDQYIDYDASINKAANTTSGSKLEQKRNLSGLEQLIQGTLGQRDLQLISSVYPDLAFTLHGTGMGKLMDSKNGLVNTSILSQALDTGLGALVNTNNMWIGDQKITVGNLDSIIYDGNDVVNVYAPTNPDGSINFGLLEQIENAKSYFNKHREMTLQDKQMYLDEMGIDATIDPSGLISTGANMKQFIAITGITSDEAVSNIDDNILSHRLTGNDKDLTFAKIKQIYAQANKGIKSKDGKFKFPTGWFDFTTDLYAAPIFLEVGDGAQFNVGTVTGNGPLVFTVPYDKLISQELSMQLATSTSKYLQ